MKILYVVHQFYPEFSSGTEKFLLNLSTAVQRDAHFPEIVAYTFVEDEGFVRKRNLLIREYRYQGLPVTSIRHRKTPADIHFSCLNADVYKFALEFLQRKGGYDLVHIGHPMRLASFAGAARDMSLPYIVTLTDFWMLCPKILLTTSEGTLCSGPEGGESCAGLCPEIQQAFIKDRLAHAREILTGAQAVVSPSNFLAGIFKKEMPDVDLRIIPHGMEFRHLKSNLKRYGSNETLTIGYCGVLAPHKGVHLLLKAFLELNPKNCQLKLYGSCFHEQDYLRYLKKMAWGDQRIQFCEPYSEQQVGDVLSDLDLLVIPSTCYENYPLVLHEALACNVPVIASNIGGMAERIEDSVNGFTFQVGDDKDLAARLKKVIDSPEILNELKQGIAKCVPPRIEEEAYMYARLYRRVIERQPPSRN